MAKSTSTTPNLSADVEKPKVNWMMVGAVAAVSVLGVYAYHRFKNSRNTPASSSSVKRQDSKAKKSAASTEKAPSSPTKSETPTTSKTVELTPSELATEAKKEGNELYRLKKYAEAAVAYTKAIETYPAKDKELSVFYCNRAACYLFLEKFTNVVDDCTEALKIQPSYVKALNRRAQAYENLGETRLALHDYTLLCMLQGFQEESSIHAADRLLKKLGKESADELIKLREPSLPSRTFMVHYFDGFDTDKEGSTVDELNALIESDSSNGVLYLRRILAAIQERKFDLVYDDCVKAVELLKDDENKVLSARAYNYLGSFQHLRGEFTASIESFTECLSRNPDDVTALLKRGTASIETRDSTQSLADFELAEKLMPESPDVHYSFAQLHFVMGKLEEALKTFKKSVSLHPKKYPPYIQLAITQFRMGDVSTAVTSFEGLLKQFPEECEVYHCYAQVMIELQQFGKALELLDQAISLDPQSAVPLVNKALIKLQSSDVDAARRLLEKAIEIDPKCDFAYERWATLELQCKNIDKAIEIYGKLIKLARNYDELVAACSFREAALSQKAVTLSHPEIVNGQLNAV